VVAYDTPGTPHAARLAEIGSVARFFAGYYTLTPDPVGLLDALRPAFAARLRASERYTDRAGTLELSLYNRGVALDYEAGAVTEVHAVAGREDPLEEFGVGIAPDWLGALALGRWGASGLADRADDVMLGRHVRLMDTLFPKLVSDVAVDL
jgi:hypothetical protein